MEKKWFPAGSAFAAGSIGVFFTVGGFIAAYMFILSVQGAIPLNVNGREVENPSGLTIALFSLLPLAFLSAGIGLILGAFTGYELDGDGITYVNAFRKRRTYRWSEITKVSSDESFCILETNSGKLKVFRQYKWDVLRAALSEHLPEHFTPSPNRPSGQRFASVPGGIYRLQQAKHLKLIIAVAGGLMVLGFTVMILTQRTPSGLLFPFAALQMLVFGVLLYGMGRTCVELTADGIVYTPKFGAPVRFAFSEIARVRYEAVKDSEGRLRTFWNIESQDGRKARIPQMEQMDELIGIVSSRMPQSAEFSGPAAL